MLGRWLGSLGALLVMAFAGPASAQTAAPHPLHFMFGEWVGTATGVAPDGTRFVVTQTERVGPLLDGEIVLVEGVGYLDTGEVAFNAFAVASPSGPDGTWEFRSYSGNRAGTFPFEPLPNGFVWSTPAGPGARMRYTATFDGNNWSQVGEYIAEGAEPRQVFAMNLTRVGTTTWPYGQAVSPQAASVE